MRAFNFVDYLKSFALLLGETLNTGSSSKNRHHCLATDRLLSEISWLMSFQMS